MSTARPAMSAPQQRGKEKQDKKPEFDYAVWDAVVSELQVRYSSYASISLTAGKAQVNKPGNMRSSDTAAFDARTGEITSVTAYDDIPRAQKMKGWFYAFHTGSWGGMTTKALYFLAAFIGGILPLSGYYLWLRGRKINCVMRCSRLNSSVGDRPAPRGGTTRPDERKVTTI